jgi:hypothetical protein
MRRRGFIAGLVSAAASPITAGAQQLAVPESSGQSVGGAHQPHPQVTMLWRGRLEVNPWLPSMAWPRSGCL